MRDVTCNACYGQEEVWWTLDVMGEIVDSWHNSLEVTSLLQLYMCEDQGYRGLNDSSDVGQLIYKLRYM